MKRELVSVAACALLLAGCSLNEVIDSPVISGQSDGAIRFGVNTPVTRAANLWDNNNFAKDAGKFNVVGLTADGTAYLGDFTTPREVSYVNDEWTYDNKLYWPNVNLNFFSWYIADNGTSALNEGVKPAANGNNTSMDFTGYKVNPVLDAQADFLVAAGTYSKAEVSTIYLKHALTKVLFKAEAVPGSQLKVTIDDVMICNLKDKGNLNVALGSEAGKPTMVWSSPSSTVTDKNLGYTMGTFTTAKELTAPAANVATPAQVSLYKGADADAYKSAMLLLPQTFTAWEPLTKKIASANGELLANAADPLLTANATGAFIGIKCSIEALDAANGSFDPKVYLHGDATTKWLYIPVSSLSGEYGEWVPNRAITYVITFGDTGSGSGGGGWTGDDGDGDGKIDPVLVPINFRTEVSEWDSYEVVLQSVNFTRNNMDNTKATIELGNLIDMLKTEAANNPQKKYAAKMDLTFGATAEAAKFAVPSLDVFAANDKFLAGSTIDITITATNGWHADGVTFPAITGWTASDAKLTANGTITYTKTEIAKIEEQRLAAMPNRAVMTVKGIASANKDWSYTTFASKGLKNSGEYLVLNFADLTANEVKITIDGASYSIGTGADAEAALTATGTNADAFVSATTASKYIVIKKK